MFNHIEVGSLLVILYVSTLILFCSYATLAIYMTGGRQHMPSILNIPARSRECLGVLVRRLRNLPTVPEVVDPAQLFGLDLSTASNDDVELAAQTVFGTMFATHFWAYPPSQRRLLRMHLVRACDRIAFHNDVRFMAQSEASRDRRRAERAQAHQGAQSSPGPHQRRSAEKAPDTRPAAGWRRVLGLAAAETDEEKIKKAYRKLARKAHPDLGGTPEMMTPLNLAFGEARDELGFV